MSSKLYCSNNGDYKVLSTSLLKISARLAMKEINSIDEIPNHIVNLYDPLTGKTNELWVYLQFLEFNQDLYLPHLKDIVESELRNILGQIEEDGPRWDVLSDLHPIGSDEALEPLLEALELASQPDRKMHVQYDEQGEFECAEFALVDGIYATVFAIEPEEDLQREYMLDGVIGMQSNVLSGDFAVDKCEIFLSHRLFPSHNLHTLLGHTAMEDLVKAVAYSPGLSKVMNAECVQVALGHRHHRVSYDEVALEAMNQPSGSAV